MKSIILMVIASCYLLPKVAAQTVVLTDKKISGCLTNCSMVSEVITQELTDSALRLKVGVHLNCAVKADTEVAIELSADTLNIIVPETQVKRDTIISKTPTTESVAIRDTRESATCKCFFHIDLTLNNCTTQANTVLINGFSLKENYRSRTIIEVEKK